jgi:hypothetical protein
MLKSYHCAICGQEKKIPLSEYSTITKSLGKTVEEIDKIDTCICGTCSKTEEYKQRFFRQTPHIVLA